MNEHTLALTSLPRLLLLVGACASAFAACTNDAVAPAQPVGSSGVTTGGSTAGSSAGGVSGGGAAPSSAGSSGNSASGASATGGGAGTAGTAGSGGVAASAGMSGGGNGGAGGAPNKSRAGLKSAGCTKPPNGAVSNSATSHRIAIPACAACTVPGCPKNCIAPPFAPGGVNAQTAGNGETFLDRDFTIELPANYDPNHSYPAFYGGNGCGSKPPLSGGGFRIPGEDAAIKVGLQQVSLESVGSCFADGGIRCAPDIKNVAACDNGPEIPYFLAVQSWVESNFCVDLGQEFVGGSSSGAWEAQLAGCGSADSVRGVYALAGGLREHRWACNGPTAAFMIASDVDQNNPVGPLPELFVIEDSYGDVPARDELLMRNGCVGRATEPYDAKYPACVKYSGCPAAYPVVWCEFAGGSHANPNYENVDYSQAIAPFLLGLPPAP